MRTRSALTVAVMAFAAVAAAGRITPALAVAVTAIPAVAAAVDVPLEVPVDVLPSVPSANAPIGAVSMEEPYDGALAGAGTAARGSPMSG